MEGTKNPILSLTIQGAIVTLLPIVGQWLKLDFGDSKLLVDSLVGMVGAIMVAYGRIRAVKKISL